MSKIKKYLSNPWIFAIGTTIIAFFVTTILNSFIKDINFKDSFFGIIKIIGQIFFNILTFRIYVWIIILVLLFLFALILILPIFAKKEIDDVPTYRNYRYFKYKEWLFTWDYSSSRYGIQIKNVRPICMKCKCELSQNSYSAMGGGGYRYYFYCPNCEEKYNYIYQNDNTLEDVEKIIVLNLNNSQYDKFEKI